LESTSREFLIHRQKPTYAELGRRVDDKGDVGCGKRGCFGINSSVKNIVGFNGFKIVQKGMAYP